MKGKLYIIFMLLLTITACQHTGNVTQVHELPPMYPDYTDITIPCNIAPLNFLLRNDPSVVEVSLKGSSKELLIRDSYKVQFAERVWKNLLEAEKGNTITVQITAKVDGEWIQYAPFKWQVVADKIDPYLSYSFLEPVLNTSKAMQIRERNLENFSERVVADNNLMENACMSCHIYGSQNPALSLFHVGGEKGALILNRNGTLRKLTTQTEDTISSTVYANFHPSGRYAVCSANGLETYNTKADIVVLDFDDNKVIPFPKNDSVDHQPFRTFPVFSADGNALYYCEAPYVTLPDSITQVMYSLHAIGFDPVTRTFGTRVDTVFSALETGYSVCHPKTSPDGKYIMYTVTNYGTYPTWHRETNLQMINLQTGEIDSLHAVNAENPNSYHSWSSDSRWFVFASKRDDGIYGKPYFSYIDNAGTPQKPFVLPQFDPAWYENTLHSFAMPELSKGKLPFDVKDIEDIYYLADSEKMTQ